MLKALYKGSHTNSNIQHLCQRQVQPVRRFYNFPDKDNAFNGKVLILHLITVKKCE